MEICPSYQIIFHNLSELSFLDWAVCPTFLFAKKYNQKIRIVNCCFFLRLIVCFHAVWNGQNQIPDFHFCSLRQGCSQITSVSKFFSLPFIFLKSYISVQGAQKKQTFQNFKKSFLSETIFSKLRLGTRIRKRVTLILKLFARQKTSKDGCKATKN